MSHVRSNRGNALLIVLGVTAIVGVVAYILPGMLIMGQAQVSESSRMAKAQQIAWDLKEIGKYLVLYEKVIFKKDPLSSNPARTAALKTIWGQRFGGISGAGNVSLLNSCGGYDALAGYVGDLKLNGQAVFCPLYLRNTMMTSQVFEDMLLEPWSEPGRSVPLVEFKAGGGALSSRGNLAEVIERVQKGRYRITIPMDNAIKSDKSNMFPINFNPRAFQDLLGQKASATIEIEVFTDSSGFKAQGNERYVKISGVVGFDDPQGASGELARFFGSSPRLEVRQSDSLVINVPTIRDFAIFMPYPVKYSVTNRSLNFNQPPVPTKRWSEAITGSLATAQVHGRVFFNGDIDVSIDALPTFYETVIITGNFVPALKPSDFAKIRTKFLKGVVTHYPAERLLFDGDCSGVKLSNINGLHCPSANFTIAHYINNIKGVCSDAVVQVGANGQLNFDFQHATFPPVRSDACPKAGFIRGGVAQIAVNAPYAFMGTPVMTLNIQSQANIYGVVLGGSMRVAAGSRFYALAHMRAGLVGIGTTEMLSQVTHQANSIYEGVGVPLENFPLIQTSKEGMN